MKKARIMLATIAVFGVVGGAVAFNAKLPSTTLYTKGGGSSCTVSASFNVVTSGVIGATSFDATTVSTTCGTYYTIAE